MSTPGDHQWRAATEDLAEEMRRIDGEITEILLGHRPALAELNQELCERRECLAELADRFRDRFAGTGFEVP